MAGFTIVKWVRSVASTIGTSFVLYGLLAIQGVFLARMLAPSGRGQYVTIVFYTQTLMYVGLVGTHHAVTRWAARRPADAGELLRVSSRIGVFTGLVTMVAVAALSLLALPADKQALIPLCLLASIALPFEHVRLLWLAVDQGRSAFTQYNLNRLIYGLAFPVLLAVAWAAGGDSVWLVTLLFAGASVLGWGYHAAVRPARAEQSSRRAPSVDRLLHRGRPYALAVLVADLCDRVDIFLFLWLTSFAVQGLYAAAVPAASVLLMVPVALGSFAFNLGARRDAVLTRPLAAKGLVLVLAGQALCAVALAAILEPLIVLVFGANFAEAVPFAMALLPAYAVAGCGRVAESYLQGRNQAALGVSARLAGVAVTCLFVATTFKRWEALSIPYGMLAGQLVSTSILVAAILRSLGHPVSSTRLAGAT